MLCIIMRMTREVKLSLAMCALEYVRLDLRIKLEGVLKPAPCFLDCQNLK